MKSPLTDAALFHLGPIPFTASVLITWAIMAVLVLGVLVRRIVGRFESMDVSRLSKLKG